MVPFNALEQMNSETLALVHANGRQHAESSAFEIARNLFRSEGSHPQVRMISVDDQRLSASGDAESRGQAMRLARERGQRFRPFGEIAGLVEYPAFERERLIGADAVGIWAPRTDGKSLRLRQLNG